MHARWLGTVPYQEAWDLQRALFEHSERDHLLLLEHPHTLTLGVRADAANVLVDAATYDGEVLSVDRGGDVTYHGPGQLVGYPILTLADHGSGEMVRTRDYVTALEELLIGVLDQLGVTGGAIRDGFPGVWLGVGTPQQRKIAAIGVRIARGRTMHGFALNVHPDLGRFGGIVPCGVTDGAVTSIAAEGVEVSLGRVVDLVADAVATTFGRDLRRSDVVSQLAPEQLTPFSRGAGPGVPLRYSSKAPRHDPTTGTSVRLMGRLAEAGVSQSVAITDRKPHWLRTRVKLDPRVLATKHTVRDLGLVTVCEEAGCPNLSECWSDGTATFMVCGERCTRACGFCLVDTRLPEALDPSEPARVAEAVARMGLRHAVVTMVARDDLDDGGAAHVAATVRAIRDRVPAARSEVLISDLAGSADALQTVIESRPDVINHNIETVPRLQRAVRPSAGYARSLALLARSARTGILTKSGIVAGMGETVDEVEETLLDLAAVGVEVVTIGQYLRPTSHHLPVANWWPPEQFAAWKAFGEQVAGLAHVESSPQTRSSHHAATAADAALSTAADALSSATDALSSAADAALGSAAVPTIDQRRATDVASA